MATPKTSINVHPKLFVGALIGIGVAVVSAIAGAISPDTFAFLGVWEAPAFSLASVGLAVLGGWLKGIKTDSVAQVDAPADPAPTAVSAPSADSNTGVAVVDVPADPAPSAPAPAATVQSTVIN